MSFQGGLRYGKNMAVKEKAERPPVGSIWRHIPGRDTGISAMLRSRKFRIVVENRKCTQYLTSVRILDEDATKLADYKYPMLFRHYEILNTRFGVDYEPAGTPETAHFASW